MTNVFELHTARKTAPDFAAKLKRAEALRRAIAHKGRFSQEDQLRAARNLHQLMAVWRRSDQFDLAGILNAVGLGGNGFTDSTKRLDTYTLPDDAPKARRDRIAKKPGKYPEIAHAVAAELNEPEAVILCQIFEGCSFGTDHEVEEDWESGNWETLAELVTKMASAVIRDCDLENYWLKVRSTNGRYDVRQGVMQPNADCLDCVPEGYGYAGNLICSDEIAPLPSIALGRRRQAPSIPGELVFSDGDSLDVDYTFWLEVRIALGPVNATDSIGPLIEFRTVLEAKTKDDQAVTFDNPFTDTTDGMKTVTIDGNALEVSSVTLSDYDLVPDAEYRDIYEHSYFAWEEVSPALLRRLLAPDDIKRTGRFDAVKRNAGVWIRELPPSRFSQGSAAHTLHVDLLTGRIERELAQVCDDLVGQLDALRTAEESRIREAEAAALARWAKRGSTKCDNEEQGE